MPTLVITNFNVVCATLGAFITLFGLISFLVKERLFLSEPRMWSLTVASCLPLDTRANDQSYLIAGWRKLLAACCKFYKASRIYSWIRSRLGLYHSVL